MPATPFTDPDQIAGPLYADPTRLARRTSALHAAKISGDDATATITALAAHPSPAAPVVCDIGCGRGTSTLHLATQLRPHRLIAVDQSAALLDTVRERLTAAGHHVDTMCADFHHLPLPNSSVDVAIAAFCLYHSPRPADVVAEIARCLAPGGRAVVVTKSADSYQEIDQLIAASGLDLDAAERPSLYTTFHSGNAVDTTATAMQIVQTQHQHQVFRFQHLEHLADYVATSPKYTLPARLAGHPRRLAAELRRRLPDRPVTATSTVTYVQAVRP